MAKEEWDGECDRFTFIVTNYVCRSPGSGTAEKYQFLKSLIRSVGRMKKWKKDDEEELKFAEADDRQTL